MLPVPFSALMARDLQAGMNGSIRLWGWGSCFCGTRVGWRAGIVKGKVPSLAQCPQQSQLWHQALVGTIVLTLCPTGLGGQKVILPTRNRLKYPLRLLNGCSRAGATHACLLAVL